MPPDILLNVRGAISRGIAAEAAIPALARPLDASDPATRRAAAIALGQTKSDAAIPYLGRALNDPTFDVRISAVRRLEPDCQPLVGPFA